MTSLKYGIEVSINLVTPWKVLVGTSRSIQETAHLFSTAHTQTFNFLERSLLILISDSLILLGLVFLSYCFVCERPYSWECGIRCHGWPVDRWRAEQEWLEGHGANARIYANGSSKQSHRFLASSMGPMKFRLTLEICLESRRKVQVCRGCTYPFGLGHVVHQPVFYSTGAGRGLVWRGRRCAASKCECKHVRLMFSLISLLLNSVNRTTRPASHTPSIDDVGDHTGLTDDEDDVQRLRRKLEYNEDDEEPPQIPLEARQSLDINLPTYGVPRSSDENVCPGIFASPLRLKRLGSYGCCVCLST